MNNLKKIVPIFIIGFLLSFFAGLIGGVSFGIILLRAILSGAILFVLSYSIVIVYNKFLSSGMTDEVEKTDTVTEKSEHSVDIVVDDELPDSATAPAFDLSNYVAPPSDNESDLPSESLQNVEVSEAADKVSFNSSPLEAITKSNSESLVDVERDAPEEVSELREKPAVTSAVSENTYSGYTDVDVEQVDDEPELGELPDIESLTVDEGTEVESESEEVIQDSVFAETGAVRPSAEPVTVSEMGDAKDIAAAIRTAMAKDV